MLYNLILSWQFIINPCKQLGLYIRLCHITSNFKGGEGGMLGMQKFQVFSYSWTAQVNMQIQFENSFFILSKFIFIRILKVKWSKCCRPKMWKLSLSRKVQTGCKLIGDTTFHLKSPKFRCKIFNTAKVMTHFRRSLPLQSVSIGILISWHLFMYISCSF